MEEKEKRIRVFFEDEKGDVCELKVVEVKQENVTQEKNEERNEFAFFNDLKSGRGTQRSFYLSQESSDFLDLICEKYDIKASNLIDKLIKNFMSSKIFMDF